MVKSGKQTSCNYGHNLVRVDDMISKPFKTYF